MTSVLETRALSKWFGGLRAVDQVDLRVEEGSIHAIIGPNGSGKSTLLNLINRVYTPTSGTVLFHGRALDGLTPTQVTVRGIARTFQNVRLFPELTVLENVMVGRHCRVNCRTLGGARCIACAWAGTFASRREEREARDKSNTLLAFVGLEGRDNLVAKNLPYGQRRLLELARALATEPSLMLLDEPAAGLSNTEMAGLMELIRTVRQNGITVLLVEHRMRLVMTVSDRITVISYGQKIAEGTPREVQENPEVIKAYLGSRREDADD